MGIDRNLSVHAACTDVGSIGEGRERSGGMGCGIYGTNQRGVSENRIQVAFVLACD
jgi:hypothetical protein